MPLVRSPRKQLAQIIHYFAHERIATNWLLAYHFE
jgi:hypothetical protein